MVDYSRPNPRLQRKITALREQRGLTELFLEAARGKDGGISLIFAEPNKRANSDAPSRGVTPDRVYALSPDQVQNLINETLEGIAYDKRENTHRPRALNDANLAQSRFRVAEYKKALRHARKLGYGATGA
ncbi:MAG: hypothetical protein H6865_07525 [Rhodospirillales bacterium]|nr:hypothetical protein [Alphaproteobacteria bacterium]MCB9987464.1 hypothetical protein [Rhodospirillales bacterium]USO07557.1 MAG: hypothetical protein H6866_09130 [Rhodospirillales bacterium]